MSFACCHLLRCHIYPPHQDSKHQVVIYRCSEHSSCACWFACLVHMRRKNVWEICQCILNINSGEKFNSDINIDSVTVPWTLTLVDIITPSLAYICRWIWCALHIVHIVHCTRGRNNSHICHCSLNIYLVFKDLHFSTTGGCYNGLLLETYLLTFLWKFCSKETKRYIVG